MNFLFTEKHDSEKIHTSTVNETEIHIQCTLVRVSENNCGKFFLVNFDQNIFKNLFFFLVLLEIIKSIQ